MAMIDGGDSVLDIRSGEFRAVLTGGGDPCLSEGDRVGQQQCFKSAEKRLLVVCKTEKLEAFQTYGDEASPGFPDFRGRGDTAGFTEDFCLFHWKVGMFLPEGAPISSSEDVFADLPGFADTCPHSGIEHFFIAQAVCAEQLAEHGS